MDFGLAKEVLRLRRNLYCILPVKHRSACIVLLAFFWAAGALAGTFFCAQADASILSLMRRVIYDPVSIVSLLLVHTFPLFIAALAVFSSRWQLLYPLCFFKAFSFSYCACGLSWAFSSGGWLIRVIALFSDLCVIPVFLWFCFSHADGNVLDLRRHFLLCFFWSIVVSCTDAWAVYPFLRDILEII